nr:protein O-linked-mannose beta-1,4-N-acetylglucosaminyltransferase 2-like [Lytechinus pictus]
MTVIQGMDASTILLTILIPLLACSMYYCLHLKQQLAAFVTTTEEFSDTSPLTNQEKNHANSSQNWVTYLEDWGSSGWCQGTTNVDRRCIFHNLCYHSEYNEFVFLHAPHSISEGIPDDRQQPALADLSSVPDHNTQYFGYVDVPSSAVQSMKNISYQEGKYLLFNRFNTGNLMHVFHDDLLPVFFTQLQLDLLNMRSGIKDATLLINDGQEEGPYFHLYKHISKQMPILTHQLSQNDSSSLTCFEEVQVGLSKLTTWYQYGFDVPQGPLEDIAVTSKEIILFTLFYKSKLNIPSCESQTETETENTFVILSRRSNRLILNEVEFSLALAQHFDAFVIVASLETHSLSELIGLISCSKGLIGVHGSLLSMSIFLPPGSILVEIFPYAVNPDNYTPYRTLAHLKGMNIIYRSWRNILENNTVTFPDAEPDLGGIAHLESEIRDQILESSEVPPHLCCNDPAWLFRIYQDTIVDINSFVKAVRDALQKSDERDIEEEIRKVPFQPGAVLELSCSTIPLPSGSASSDDDDYEVGLLLSWKPPWNIPFIQNTTKAGYPITMEYEVMIQEQGMSDLYAGTFRLSMTSHLFKGNFKNSHVYFAWVRCIAGDVAGPYVAITSCPYIEN